MSYNFYTKLVQIKLCSISCMLNNKQHFLTLNLSNGNVTTDLFSKQALFSSNVKFKKM